MDREVVRWLEGTADEDLDEFRSSDALVAGMYRTVLTFPLFCQDGGRAAGVEDALLDAFKFLPKVSRAASLPRRC